MFPPLETFLLVRCNRLTTTTAGIMPAVNKLIVTLPGPESVRLFVIVAIPEGGAADAEHL